VAVRPDGQRCGDRARADPRDGGDASDLAFASHIAAVLTDIAVILVKLSAILLSIALPTSSTMGLVAFFSQRFSLKPCVFRKKSG